MESYPVSWNGVYLWVKQTGYTHAVHKISVDAKAIPGMVDNKIMSYKIN
jgi:hypothetical protein